MIEIKHIKSLPAKTVNKKTGVIQVNGAELYEDNRGNRYAYLSFKLLRNEPCFFIAFALKEYNREGVLIKESKYYLPNIYVKGLGDYVMEEPMAVEKDTEGIDVYVLYAELKKCVFLNDEVVSNASKDAIREIKGMPECAPSVVEEIKMGPVTPPVVEEEKVPEIVEEEKPVEEKKVEPVAEETKEEPVTEEAKEEPAPVEEEKKPEPVAEETPAVEQAEETPAPEAQLPTVSKTQYFTRGYLRYVGYALGVIIFGGLTFLVMYLQWIISMQ